MEGGGRKCSGMEKKIKDCSGIKRRSRKILVIKEGERVPGN
jgi:hypothetical protein